MHLAGQEKWTAFFQKIRWKELLAFLFILLGIYFFRQQRHELHTLIPFLKKANSFWIGCGILVTVLYVMLQTGLLIYCFKTVQKTISWSSSLSLFLKQNFLSVFLPGGSVATFAYLPSILRRENIERQKIFQAVALQGIIGIFTVVIVGLPVILYTILNKKIIKGALAALIFACLLVVILTWLISAFRKKGKPHRLMIKFFPSTEKYIEELFSFSFSWRQFSRATLVSIGIELAGITHLYIAMLASGVSPSVEAAFTGYIVSTLFLIISPFLKGLGAVELSLVYILKLYGFSTLMALEITLLYRVFEFWLPLAAGLIAWAWKGKNIFLRLLPPVLIFLLGTVNIFSVLTPPIALRLRLIKEYIPASSIHASNGLIILTGLILIMTSAFLMKGLKGAWWLCLLLSIVSLIGHLTKALDYEEAFLALIVILILIFTRKQYRLKSNPTFSNIGLATAIGALITVLLFGAIGYYFLNKRHFGIDFNWRQSFSYAFSDILLIGQNNLHPVTNFGNEFIVFLKILASGAWIFLFYFIIRPYINKTATSNKSIDKARFLLSRYGASPLDYFKIDADKLLYISDKYEGFISYKVANGFAIVLEEPVCAENKKIPMLREFEILCRKMGLKPAFYRVDEESLYYFAELKKKKLLIGQEAIMQINDFTLEGRQNKSLRNALNSLAKKGYSVRLHNAPHTNEFIQELKLVSDEWLAAYKRNEKVFSQGMFDPVTIRQQDVIALYDNINKLVAFLTIIPDYTPDECTYDLIRKTVDAPGGCIDALVIKLVEYAKEKNLSYLNLGLVPMSGINIPDNTAERVVKYAYEKIRRFKDYQGLREFKEKYATRWVNKYLLYDNDFDLMQLPVALNKVMQPGKIKN